MGVVLIEQNVYNSYETNEDTEIQVRFCLTLKAPTTTAADDIHKYFIIVFQRR